MKPNLMQTPTFKIEILSTGEKYTFRSMIHKEEKKLAIALEQLTKQENDSQREVLESILDVIKACCKENIEPEKLAFYDIEFIFLKLRSSSIGETQLIEKECEKCSSPNMVVIDFNSVELSSKELKTDIQLRDNFWVRMKKPSIYFLWDTLSSLNENMGYEEIEKVISQSIDYFYDSEQVYKYTEEEIISFINENFTKKDLESVMEYFNNIPRLKMKLKENCASCGFSKDVELSGIYDFL